MRNNKILVPIMSAMLRFQSRSFLLVMLLPVALAASSASTKDKSSSYQLGVYMTNGQVGDGTITDTTSCGTGGFGGIVCSGGISNNSVTVYRVKTSDGTWFLETYRQAQDETTRKVLNEAPIHFTREKDNPLDLLKGGERVLFRVEEHRKLIGSEVDVFIPYANNPDKEAKFVGTFVSDVAPSKPKVPTDNVRAMCDAHKLSPDLEKQLCAEASGSSASASVEVQPAIATVRKPRDSYCTVQSSPGGAWISIDGKVVGVTPMVFMLLAHGDTPRQVAISMDGYKTILETRLPDGLPIALNETLEKQ